MTVDSFDALAQRLGAVDFDRATAAAARAIGADGRAAFAAARSGILPADGKAHHGKIRGRNRAAGASYRIDRDAGTGEVTVTVTPRGDLWYVMARGRRARPGRHGGTRPLEARPELYTDAQRRVAAGAAAHVDRAVVGQLTRILR